MSYKSEQEKCSSNMSMEDIIIYVFVFIFIIWIAFKAFQFVTTKSTNIKKHITTQTDLIDFSIIIEPDNYLQYGHVLDESEEV
jgi:uncharacterized membrane protein YadS